MGKGRIVMSPKLRAILLLVAASFIWGISYPLHRYVLDGILSPWAFASLRYFFGSVLVVPIAFRWRKHPAPAAYLNNSSKYLWLIGGSIAGLILSIGTGLQFTAMTNTTASKAGFITGLYVIMVPLLGFILGQMPKPLVWFSLLIGLVGLYVLSGLGSTGADAATPGDALLLVADIFWALHVIVMGYFASKVNPWLFTATQSTVCSLVAFVMACFTGTLFTLSSLYSGFLISAWGIMSVGVAYLFQAMAQRDASPTSAALVMQLQAIIAAIAGVVFLGEEMTDRMIIGATILIIGTLAAQFAGEATTITNEHKYWKQIKICRISLLVFIVGGGGLLSIWAIGKM